MDIKVTQTETCSCGRQVISITGSCAKCIAESAEAFRLYMDGQITAAGFYRRLRRIGAP